MSLMEADFSLFGGELLFPPPTVSSDGEEAVTGLEDGHLVIKTIQAPKKGGQTTEELTSLSSCPSSPEVLRGNEAVSGELQQGWLDTPVDLLSLFCDDLTKLTTDHSSSFGIDLQIDATTTPTTKDTYEADLETLKGLSEDIAIGLSTSAQEALIPPVLAPLVSAPTTPDTDQSGLTTGDVYDTGLGLLDLLTEAVTNSSFDVTQMTDLDLLPFDDTTPYTSPILSPVSPEDVETILSSGPTSPVSCATEDRSTFEALISPENTLIDFTMMDTTDASLTGDLEELARMVSLPSDHNQYSANPPAAKGKAIGGKTRAKKARPGPYQRTKKITMEIKEESSETESENGKIVDRKLRKKQQNKDAATRYRQKKKQEQDVVNKELEELENKNDSLKGKVDQMTKEIQYLKNLLVDVQKARLRREKSQ